jgi:hypothetical protein
VGIDCGYRSCFRKPRPGQHERMQLLRVEEATA